MSIDTTHGLADSEMDAESSDAGPLDIEQKEPARSLAAPAPPRRRPQASRSQRRRMWVVGAVILASIGFLVYKGLTSAIVFFKTANEAVAERAQLGNTDFQMEGTVVGRSVHHVRGDVYRFAVVSSGVTVEVENTGYPPQMFKPGLPVVVVGHFVGTSNLFASDEIMVKHSAAYIAAYPNRVKPASGSSP